MDFTRYITKQGDRWDLIAWLAYGDITKQRDVMAANPEIDLVNVFDEGITLLLPIIENTGNAEDSLPPWKRNPAVVEQPPILIERATANGSIGSGSGHFDYFFDFLLS